VLSPQDQSTGSTPPSRGNIQHTPMQYSSPGSIHSDGTYKLQVGVSIHREQYTSGGSIHPQGTIYFMWEYPPSTPHLGVSIQMEHIIFRWEYPPTGNNILQVGGSIHPEGTVYCRWDYPPSTPHLGVFIQMEHINFSWEYLPGWNKYSILQVGVSTQ
jgi:hypothetical protein